MYCLDEHTLEQGTGIVCGTGPRMWPKSAALILPSWLYVL